MVEQPFLTLLIHIIQVHSEFIQTQYHLGILQVNQSTIVFLCSLASKNSDFKVANRSVG